VIPSAVRQGASKLSERTRPTRVLRDHAAVALLYAALIALTIVVLEPARALAANWNEFSIGFGELAARLTAPGLATFGLFGLASLVLARLLAARGVALLVGLYVGLWLQTSVLLWAYGPFDGRPIDWEAYSREGAIDLLAWATVIGLALWRAEWVRRRAVWIGAFVLGLHAISIGEVVVRGAPYPERAHAVAVSDFGTLSSEGNALVIVLDTLQSDFFAELLLDAEFSASVPPGFTYYRNATSYYGSTQFSLQSILTSQRVPDGVEPMPFMVDAMRRSVAARLGAAGIDARVATFATGNMPACQAADGPYPCVHLGELLGGAGDARENRWRADVSELLRVGWFRASPQIAKRRLRGRGGWLVEAPFPRIETDSSIDPRIDERARTDLLLIAELSSEARVVDGAPRFRFLHLHMPHHPVSVDGSCAYTEVTEVLELERWQLLDAARCILGRVFDYLGVIAAVGAYDASATFIAGDHGSHLPVDRSVAQPPLPAAVGDDPGHDWTSRGLPLFLLKLPGERGELRVSDRPVALCDVPSSVHDVLGLPAAYECPSLLEAPPADRQRTYYRYPDYFEQRRRRLTRFEFEAYEVRGHAWHVESWRAVP
jgi:hypothetical protein